MKYYTRLQKIDWCILNKWKEGNKMKRIGIIGAMELEVEALKAAMQLEKIEKKASMNFYVGSLNGKEVVIVQSGIGKVNAAMCTQILCDLFDIEYIINTGIAGALHQDLNIGDLVISTDCIQHDVDVTAFGYVKGRIPGFTTPEFLADQTLQAAAKEVNEKVNPDIHTFLGRIVSGDQFISSHETKEYLIQEFQGYCAEMEGASIAQAATLNQIPFVILRAISDKADGSAHMDYPQFEREAAAHSAKLVQNLLPLL